MKIKWKYPLISMLFSILIAVSISMSPGLSSPLVHAQVPSPTSSYKGPGTIITSITGGSPAGAASFNPAAKSSGKITTSITGGSSATPTPRSSPTAPNNIAGTPVDHTGGGIITTSSGPAVPHNGASIAVAGPSFQVSGACAPNADGLLTITNTGGAMTTPFTWRLSLNGIPISQSTFLISPGQTFNVSTSGLYGTLTLDVLDPTNTVVATGSMFCLSPTATPTLVPPVPPSFQVSGACAPNADGLLTITNTGGAMTTPFTWRLSLNGIPISQNTFLISPGQTFNVSTSGLYGTLTMDVLDLSNTVVSTGSMFCLSPTATPTLVPPSFQVSGACAPNAEGVLAITNTGGDMTAPFTWRLSLNGIPIAQNTFLISPGQTFNVSTSGLYGTLTMDVLDPSNTVVATGSMFCLSPTATGGSPTAIPTDTNTPTPTDTFTPSPTATNTDTPTPTFTPSPTSTFTPTPTATPIPVPPRVVASYPSDHSRLTKGPSNIVIVFSQDLIHDGFGNAANNPSNYLLVENGLNNKFDTTSCQAGRSGDDVAMTIPSVQYSRVLQRGHLSFIAILKINPALRVGDYRLFVCGSTSIENLAGIKLNNGSDTTISFRVVKNSYHGDR